MKRDTFAAAIVVGIDGSTSAIHAAEWAVEEAISRDCPVRMFYILEQHSEAVKLETEFAEAALLTARAAVEASGRHVKIETAVVRGHPKAVLAHESRSAHLIVVGALGAGHPTRRPLGTTAAALVRMARCPLAIIRTPPVAPSDRGVIAVLIEDSQRRDTLLRSAMDEARLRGMPLLTVSLRSPVATDVGIEQIRQSRCCWQHRYPDVAVETVAIDTSPAEFLSETDRTLRLVIIDGNERSALIHAYCSVLLVK